MDFCKLEKNRSSHNFFLFTYLLIIMKLFPPPQFFSLCMYFDWFLKHDFDFPSKGISLSLINFNVSLWHFDDIVEMISKIDQIFFSLLVLQCTMYSLIAQSKKCWFWLLKHARYVWSLRAVQVLKVNLSYYERNLSKKYQYLA